MGTKAARKFARKEAELHRLKQVAYRAELRAQKREFYSTPINRIPVDPDAEKVYFTMRQRSLDYECCAIDDFEEFVADQEGTDFRKEEPRLFVLVATQPKIPLPGRRLTSGSITGGNARYTEDYRPEMRVLLEVDPKTKEPLTYDDEYGEGQTYGEITVSVENPLFTIADSVEP